LQAEDVSRILPTPSDRTIFHETIFFFPFFLFQVSFAIIMGRDVYCAFCGTLIGTPFWEEADYPYAYDADVLTHEDTQWMDDVRIIGENPDCTLPSK
jgi:hypothetical protein